MYYAYASDPQSKLNLGIRRRLAPLLDNDRRRIELLNCLLLTLPGSPIVYYGDENGKGDNGHLKAHRKLVRGSGTLSLRYGRASSKRQAYDRTGLI